MAVTPCCSEKYASLLLCCRTSKLRSAWFVLPVQHGKATIGNISQVYERRACNETSTRLLVRYLVGHVYRNNSHALWEGPRRHCWSNFKARSCYKVGKQFSYMHRNSEVP